MKSSSRQVSGALEFAHSFCRGGSRYAVHTRSQNAVRRERERKRRCRNSVESSDLVLTAEVVLAVDVAEAGPSEGEREEILHVMLGRMRGELRSVQLAFETINDTSLH